MTVVSINNQQPKLLIIDDEKEITDYVEWLVEDLDWLVLSINDSDLISSTCKSFIPDVIFLDLGLPGYSGAEVIHHLADLECKAKIYLISGLDRMSLESYQASGVGFNLNIVSALTKPFTREDIYHALAIQEASPEDDYIFQIIEDPIETKPGHTFNSEDLIEPIRMPPESNNSLTRVSGEGASMVDALSSLGVEEGGPSKDVITRNVTILLSDIRGFSEITEHYPATDVVSMLNRYFDVMGNIITGYGGNINKLMGDSILVIFGLPETGSDDVQNALACAIAMQLAMTDLNKVNQTLNMPDLHMGIAVNTGDVVAGEIGSRHYKEYTVIGNTVNLTSRIETHCLRGQILISEYTYKEARGAIEVGAPNTIEVKGLRGALDLYELRSTSKPTFMKAPRRERRRSPRIEVNLPVSFQILNGKIVLNEKHHGEVVNISYNGMLIQTNTQLAKSSELKISLAMELFGNRATDIYAKIIRTESLDGKFHSSLEFTTIGSEALTTIKQYVDLLVGNA